MGTDLINESDKENNPPSDCHLDTPEVSVDLKVESNSSTLGESQNNMVTGCQRCGKRRLTEVEAAVESISPSKKSKCENDNNNQNYHTLKSSTTDSCNTQASSGGNKAEAMQITSLVHSFSAGFTGLLNTDSVPSQQQCDNNTVVSAKDSESGHTSASDSLHSCSTQIKEAFETLARPIIAMTV